MSSIAFVFPGQGSQTVGMGRDLAASSAAAAAVFRRADVALGEPISALAWDGPAERAIVAMGVAALATHAISRRGRLIRTARE